MNLKENITLPAVDGFVEAQMSKMTAIAYKADLVLFESWIRSRGIPLLELKMSDIAAYRGWLVSKSYAKLTVNRKLATVKSYFKFLIRNQIAERNPTEFVKALQSDDYRETLAASNDEVLKIFDSVNVKTKTGRMHLALLHCLFFLGIRRSECINLKISDIRMDGETPVVIVNGKGNKRRSLPLPSAVLDALGVYLKDRIVSSESEPVFISTASNCKNALPLSPTTIAKIVNRYKVAAGITKRITPHSARATAITNALENGASIGKTMAMGGWKSAAMVMRYEKRRNELKNSAVFAVNYKK